MNFSLFFLFFTAHNLRFNLFVLAEEGESYMITCGPHFEIGCD
jgi:hypothetical protein